MPLANHLDQATKSLFNSFFQSVLISRPGSILDLDTFKESTLQAQAEQLKWLLWLITLLQHSPNTLTTLHITCSPD